MQGFSSGYPNDSSDGFVQDFFTDGSLCDQYVSPWGYVRPFDVSVQVFGVPEPSTLVLLGIGAISLATYAWRRRRQAAA